MEQDAAMSPSSDAAERCGSASTPEMRCNPLFSAAAHKDDDDDDDDDDDVYGEAFNAERPSAEGVGEPWPRARRAGGCAVRAAVVAAAAALFSRLAASHPRIALALLALAVAANRWLQRAFDVGTRFAFSLHSPPDSFVVAPEEVLGWGPFTYRSAGSHAPAR